MSNKSSIRIVLLSDLHLTNDKKPIWGVNTYSYFQKAINRLKRIPQIDCIIVCGDISDDGLIGTYSYVDNVFHEMGIPTLWCPGNHDNLKNYYDFGQKSFCKLFGIHDIGGFRFISLCSVTHDENDPSQNRARGLIKDRDLAFLDETLTVSKMPCIVYLHHPSMEPGGWLSNKILINREEVNKIFKKHNQVKAVLSGHIHYYTKQKEGSTVYISSPAIGYAFNKNLPKFKIATGEEGFVILDVSELGIKTELIRI